jgi:hypothetical protein
MPSRCLYLWAVPNRKNGWGVESNHTLVPRCYGDDEVEREPQLVLGCSDEPLPRSGQVGLLEFTVT